MGFSPVLQKAWFRKVIVYIFLANAFRICSWRINHWISPYEQITKDPIEFSKGSCLRILCNLFVRGNSVINSSRANPKALAKKIKTLTFLNQGIIGPGPGPGPDFKGPGLVQKPPVTRPIPNETPTKWAQIESARRALSNGAIFIEIRRHCDRIMPRSKLGKKYSLLVGDKSCARALEI